MENSFFIFTDTAEKITLERFHVCSWEFKNSSLVEFGFEIQDISVHEKDSITISLLIPWLTKECKIEDLYRKLRIGDNSRFIFNDSIKKTEYLKDNSDEQGVVHTFCERNKLCLLPIEYKLEDRLLNIKIDLKDYQKRESNKPNIYVRFWINPIIPYISVRKNGISKSTIIYDFKINERRNISSNDLKMLSNKQFCSINTCFMFHILPNNYDIVFFDNKSLKNVRTLEYKSFSRYLNDNRIKENELIVVFNKREESDSFSFFSVFSKERIGPGQFALAIFVNILCGILLFVPSYKKSFTPELEYSSLLQKLPFEIWIAIIIAGGTLIYFIWPVILLLCNQFFNRKL